MIEEVGVGVEESLVIFGEVWQAMMLEKLRHEAGVCPSREVQMARAVGYAEDEFRSPLEGLDPGSAGSDESSINIEQNEFDHSYSVC